MPVHQIFIINRAGSLIYSWEGAGRARETEKTFSFPLPLRLGYVDQRATVTFGSQDGVRPGHVLLALNGRPVPVGGRIFVPAPSQPSTDPADPSQPQPPQEVEVDVLEWLGSQQADSSSPPVSLRFGRLALSANEKIILSSMFHSLHTIGAQLSPLNGSSGIQTVDTDTFRLQCFQTVTGGKFVVVTEAGGGAQADTLLRRLYEAYADFALKNPFYSLDMPIRCAKFDQHIDLLLAKHEKGQAL